MAGVCASIYTFMEGPIHNSGPPYKYATEECYHLFRGHSYDDVKLLRTINPVQLHDAKFCIYCQERSELKSITHND